MKEGKKPKKGRMIKRVNKRRTGPRRSEEGERESDRWQAVD